MPILHGDEDEGDEGCHAAMQLPCCVYFTRWASRHQHDGRGGGMTVMVVDVYVFTNSGCGVGHVPRPRPTPALAFRFFRGVEARGDTFLLASVCSSSKIL